MQNVLGAEHDVQTNTSDDDEVPELDDSDRRETIAALADRLLHHATASDSV